MKPAPYAGFDPQEDDFDDNSEMAPLHEQDFAKRQPRTRINIDRARQLKLSGRSWREIGRLLAIEEGRRMVYNAQSIWFAVNCAVPVSPEADA